jgi:hypothetical protein
MITVYLEELRDVGSIVGSPLRESDWLVIVLGQLSPFLDLAGHCLLQGLCLIGLCWESSLA